MLDPARETSASVSLTHVIHSVDPRPPGRRVYRHRGQFLCNSRARTRDGMDRHAEAVVRSWSSSGRHRDADPSVAPLPQDDRRRVVILSRRRRIAPNDGDPSAHRLCGAGDVACDAPAGAAAQCHLRSWRRRKIIRRAVDRTGTRRTAERCSGPVMCDEVQCLCWIVSNRSRFPHWALRPCACAPLRSSATLRQAVEQ